MIFLLKSDNKFFIISAVGFIAGTVNGLLGAGGGIMITYCLSYIAKDSIKDRNVIFANALVTMLPISLVSSIIYFAKGHIALDGSMAYFMIPALLGGACGALLLKKLSFKTVKILFTAIVIYSGASMLFG